tara:strand:- start:981 stop:1292 length:312 start_codon:yes stop_codon:yes gene_type:complete
MRDEERFEVERALDLLPHITGGSWAMVWFRMRGIKNPTREEFRNKVIEFFFKIESLLKSFDSDESLNEISSYIKNRFENEIKQIRMGENEEIEKRYQRYIDYG